MEYEGIDLMTQIIELLKSQRSHWTIEEGVFAFEKDEDLVRFNQLVEQADILSKKQLEIKKQLSNGML